MKHLIALAFGLILGTVATVQASEAKAPKLAVCTNFNTFKADDGAMIGICDAKKPGGKVTYLRSFVVTSVINPSTDKAERLMAGFE